MDLDFFYKILLKKKFDFERISNIGWLLGAIIK